MVPVLAVSYGQVEKASCVDLHVSLLSYPVNKVWEDVSIGVYLPQLSTSLPCTTLVLPPPA